MYQLLILLGLFIIKDLNAQDVKEYKFNWYPKIQVNDGVINLPDSSKFEIYNTSGVWEDSLGNYGIMKCLVSQFINDNKEVSLNAFCEARDSENEKFWMSLKRHSFNKAGIGKSNYLFAQSRFSILEGKECPYAAQLLEGGGVFKMMCKLSKDEYKALEKMIIE